VSALTYQPIYGEQAATTAEAAREELYSLPIVVARSEAGARSESALDDADIEAAFREPIVVVEEDAPEDKSPVATLSQQFLALYRPVVNGVSNSGAIVNGQFWSVGESMVTLSVRTVSGEALVPRLRSIGSSSVVVALGEESLSLAFSGN